MKITIAVPHTGTVRAETAACIADLLPRIKGEYYLMMVETALIAEGRNKAFRQAKESGADYLLFIDSDIVFPLDGLEKLLAHSTDVATGIYYMSGRNNYRPCIYRFTASGMVENFALIPDKPFRVDAAGCGFMLISRRVLEVLPGNAFDHLTINGVQLGEDVSFCHRLRDAGLAIMADPSIRLGHIKTEIVYKEHFDVVMRKLVQSLDKTENGISGWTTDEELFFLAEKARKMDSIVELGSHKGRSAKVLLDNCPGTVTCVDLWDGKVEFGGGDERHHLYDGDAIFREFLSNVDGYPGLRIKRMSTLDAAKSCNGDRFDMVFIDAGHDYESVKVDIAAWLPKTTKLICGHDYSDGWPGVKKAVDEAFGSVEVAGTIWYKELDHAGTAL